MAAAESPCPADGRVDPFAVATDRDDHLLDQETDDPLAVCRRRRRRLPQGWQIARQGADVRALASRQACRLMAVEASVFLFEAALLLQGFLPAPLQFPHHQTVLRFDRIVLSPRPLRLVAG